MRYNADWLARLSFEDLIGLAANFTVQQFLARDNFSLRYERGDPIWLHEFFYSLMQSYDAVSLDTDVQIGGTDQLFNLLLGRELQKVMGQAPQCVMTLPLIEGLDGIQKMSKSLNNYVGIAEPAREMYGKLMSVPDDLMWKYFEYILCWPKDKVQAMHAQVASGELHPRAAKDTLGQAVVTRFISEIEAQQASEEFTRIFAQKELPDEIPEVVVPAEEIGLLALMVHAGLVKSNGDARRLVKQGAVKINDEKISDERAQITPEDGMVIRSGKRGFAQIKIG